MKRIQKEVISVIERDVNLRHFDEYMSTFPGTFEEFEETSNIDELIAKYSTFSLLKQTDEEIEYNIYMHLAYSDNHFRMSEWENPNFDNLHCYINHMMTDNGNTRNDVCKIIRKMIQ